EQFATGTAHGIQQDKTQATKAPKLTKEHGLIDWARSAREVCNQIRAMQPWPTAYTYWHRQGQPPLRVIIHKAAAVESQPESPFLPGQLMVLAHGSPRLLVAAGQQTVVEIRELQPAGKR